MSRAVDVVQSAQSVIDAALAMNRLRINAGTSGNVSLRLPDGSCLITPSGVAYDHLGPDDIVLLDRDGIPDGLSARRPSSEWRIHVDLYAARPDVSAIVHAHPINATALSAHGRGIEAFHYMVAVAGGHDIRCAPYATFGTAELSRNAIDALVDRRACLLANHGIVALGSDLDSALGLAVEVEVLAAQYLAASALGEPVRLSHDEIDRVLAKMAEGEGYGSS